MGVFQHDRTGVSNVRRSFIARKVGFDIFQCYWSEIMLFYTAIEIPFVLFPIVQHH